MAAYQPQQCFARHRAETGCHITSSLAPVLSNTASLRDALFQQSGPWVCKFCIITQRPPALAHRSLIYPFIPDVCWAPLGTWSCVRYMTWARWAPSDNWGAGGRHEQVSSHERLCKVMGCHDREKQKWGVGGTKETGGRGGVEGEAGTTPQKRWWLEKVWKEKWVC